MKYDKSVYRALALVGQCGILMLVPIFMCSFMGILLDRWLDASYWMVLLFFAGALAGFRNIYLFAKKIDGKKDAKDDADAAGRRRGRK